jgi:Flp pilus assembly pilin Flp
MKNLGHGFFREEDGQDIIEYAFLAAFISVVAFAILVSIGTDVTNVYSATGRTTSAAAGAAS